MVQAESSSATVAVVDDLPDHVGDRLVDGAALVQHEQARGAVHVAVGELVRHDVVGGGVPLPEDHLGAVPERVGVGTAEVVLAVPVVILGRSTSGPWTAAPWCRHRRPDELRQVDPGELVVGLRGGAEVVVGLVDVREERQGRTALGAGGPGADRHGVALLFILRPALSQIRRLMFATSLKCSAISPRPVPTSTVSRISEPLVTSSCHTGRVPSGSVVCTTAGS